MRHGDCFWRILHVPHPEVGTDNGKKWATADSNIQQRTPDSDTRHSKKSALCTTDTWQPATNNHWQTLPPLATNNKQSLTDTNDIWQPISNNQWQTLPTHDNQQQTTTDRHYRHLTNNNKQSLTDTDLILWKPSRLVQLLVTQLPTADIKFNAPQPRKVPKYS